MSWYGMAFLESSVGATIRRLCAEKVAIEVDPVRIGKGGRAVEKNVELLVVWCQEFWDRIYDARRQCPPCVSPIVSVICGACGLSTDTWRI